MRHANKIWVTCLLLLFTSAAESCKRSPQFTESNSGDLSGQRVANYDAWGGDFSTMLVQMAQKYELPIGMDLERAKKSQLATRHISNGNVADILNSVVSQEPGYEWADVGGVINVTPKDRKNSILDVRIAKFKVTDANPFEIHDAIVSLPEVKRWLADNQLAENTGFAGIIPVGRNGPALPRTSINMHNVTLEQILNAIVKSGLSSWNISRWGDNSQYLSISVG